MNLIPKQFAHVPSIYLHYIAMGQGSLYRSGKAVIAHLPDPSHPLSCGCDGSKAVLIYNDQGDPAFKELTHLEEKSYVMEEYFTQPFNGKEWNEYWESFYKKYEYLRPIKINNLI